uniref:Variant surface glycoprotein 1125.4310 n=1 Tax=Trypanosoma brucei TaxID=5691 RepID=A0A1J0RAS8_9TRYP|nr:variant surface glycoprotein 1125.4310 [Trypanosoma brucei]
MKPVEFFLIATHILAASLRSNAAMPDDAITAATTPCKVIHLANALAQGFVEKTTAAKSALKTLQSQASAAMLRSSAASDKKQMQAFGMLQALAQLKFDKLNQALSGIQPKVEAASTALKEFAAEVSFGRSLSERTAGAEGTTSKETTVPKRATDADDSCKYTGQKLLLGTTACPDKSSYGPALASAVINPTGLTKFPKIDNEFFTEMQYDLYAYVKGEPESAAGSKATACSEGTVSVPTSTASHVFGAWITNHKKSHTITPTPLKAGSSACPDNPTSTDTPANRYQQLQKHLCEYADLSLTVPTPLEALLNKDLVQDSDMQQLATAFLLGKGGAGTTAASIKEDQIKQLIAQLYGSGENSFKENYVAALGKTEITYKTTEEPTTQTANSVEESNKAGLALAYFLGRTATAQTQASTGTESEGNSKTDASEKTEEKKDVSNTAKPVCSSFQNQTECEAVKGTIPPGKKSVCGWIEEKCQDSSFLVNKQFALSMVSAACVALLF